MSKRARKPPFVACMAMMRSRDPQEQEDGFHLLRHVAYQYVHELVTELQAEQDAGLKRWLLELLTNAREPASTSLFICHLNDQDECLRHWAEFGLRLLDTKDARAALLAAGRGR